MIEDTPRSQLQGVHGAVRVPQARLVGADGDDQGEIGRGVRDLNLSKKEILFLFSSYCSKRQDHEGDPDEPDQGGNKHRVQRRLLGEPSTRGVLVLQRQQAGRVGEGEDHDDPDELVPAHGGLHAGDGRGVRVQDREQAGQRQDEGEPDCQSNDRQM